MIFTVLSFLLPLTSSQEPSEAPFNYLDHGANWAVKYKSSCFTNKKFQSPVDLGGENTYLADEAQLYLFPKYQEALVSYEEYNASYKIKAQILPTQSFLLGPLYTVNPLGLSVAYQGLEIYFRSESEHTIRGQRFPLEIQINHEYLFKANSNKSSLAVFFVEDDSAPPNLFLQKIIDNFQNKNFLLDLNLLLPASISIEPYFYYQGSLTIPSCTEKTQWIILETPRKAPKSQIEFFYQMYHDNPKFSGSGNYRDTQSFRTTAQNVRILYRQNPFQDFQ